MVRAIASSLTVTNLSSESRAVLSLLIGLIIMALLNVALIYWQLTSARLEQQLHVEQRAIASVEQLLRQKVVWLLSDLDHVQRRLDNFPNAPWAPYQLKQALQSLALQKKAQLTYALIDQQGSVLWRNRAQMDQETKQVWGKLRQRFNQLEQLELSSECGMANALQKSYIYCVQHSELGYSLALQQVSRMLVEQPNVNVSLNYHGDGDSVTFGPLGQLHQLQLALRTARQAPWWQADYIPQLDGHHSLGVSISYQVAPLHLEQIYNALWRFVTWGGSGVILCWWLYRRYLLQPLLEQVSDSSLTAKQGIADVFALLKQQREESRCQLQYRQGYNQALQGLFKRPVIVVDSKANVVEINQTTLDWLELPREQVMGRQLQYLLQLVHGDKMVSWQALLQPLFNRQQACFATSGWIGARMRAKRHAHIYTRSFTGELDGRECYVAIGIEFETQTKSDS